MNIELSGLEWWRTDHLLIEYERLFGPLEPKSRERILETARVHDWDRTWSERAA